MYTAILFCDPGLRSGWASWENGRFSAGICDPEDMCDVLERWANAHAGMKALLGFEKFTVTADTAHKDADALHWPWELTGVGRYLAWRNEIAFQDSQTPRSAKTFAPDERLRAQGMYTPGKEDHARDASRHLLLKLSRLRLVTLHPYQA